MGRHILIQFSGIGLISLLILRHGRVVPLRAPYIFFFLQNLPIFKNFYRGVSGLMFAYISRVIIMNKKLHTTTQTYSSDEYAIDIFPIHPKIPVNAKSMLNFAPVLYRLTFPVILIFHYYFTRGCYQKSAWYYQLSFLESHVWPHTQQLRWQMHVTWNIFIRVIK